MPNTASRLSTQLGRFVVIGSLSAATDLGGYYLLTALGLNAALAKAISFVLGMVLGWVGNKFWTFESTSRSVGEPIAYVTWYAITLGFNVLVNFVALLVLREILADDWAKALAVIIATGASAAANFVGLRWIVFTRQNSNHESPKNENTKNTILTPC